LVGDDVIRVVSPNTPLRADHERSRRWRVSRNTQCPLRRSILGDRRWSTGNTFDEISAGGHPPKRDQILGAHCTLRQIDEGDRVSLKDRAIVAVIVPVNRKRSVSIRPTESIVVFILPTSNEENARCRGRVGGIQRVSAVAIVDELSAEVNCRAGIQRRDCSAVT